MHYVTYYFFVVRTTGIYYLSMFLVGVPLFTKRLYTYKLI